MPRRQTTATTIKHLRAILSRLEENDFSTPPEDRAVREAITKLKTLNTFTFSHAEALGMVELSEGAYGVCFDVKAPDGTTYSGFLDLFHFSESSGEKCFQVVVSPVSGEGNTFHARFYPDGRVRSFGE